MKKESLNKKMYGISISVLVLFVAVLASLSAAAPSIWKGDKDTTWYVESAQAFNLTTAEELAGLAYLVNNGKTFQGKTITLGADIFLNDTTGAGNETWNAKEKFVWTPIGTQSNPFKGEFDGLAGKKNRKIYGLYINDTTKTRIGLFGYTEGVKISNLDLLVGKIVGGNTVGALVGNASNGSVENVHSELDVSGKNWVGGLIGWSTSSITDCVVKASVVGQDTIGGLAGYSSKTVKNSSHSEGNVKGGNYVGGLIGLSNYATPSSIDVLYIENSYSIGSVEGYSFVGGLIGADISSGNGSSNKKIIFKSYSEGLVNGKSNVGGFIGSIISAGNYISYVTIDSCSHNKGNVIADSIYVGGLLGYASNADMLIKNSSHEIGLVKGSKYVGGLIGFHYAPRDSISNSFANGDVYGDDFTGGLVGYSISLIKESYHKGNIVGNNNVGGLAGYGYRVEKSFHKGSVQGKNNTGGLIGQAYNVFDSFSEGNVIGESYVGGLVGFSEGNVVRTHVLGNIVGNKNYVGGLVGYSLYSGSGQVTISTAEDSYVNGNVSGANYVGGLVGFDSINGMSPDLQISKPILRSFFDGSVKGHNYVGGIAGKINGGFSGNASGSGINFYMRSVYHTNGEIYGDSNYVGGIVGYTFGLIFDSYTLSNVVIGKDTIGGIAGFCRRNIVNAYSNGIVKGVNIVGGLAGYVNSITSSYFVGDSVTGVYQVGGLVGVANGNVDSSFSIANVKGDDNVGGLIGSSYGNISYSYAAGDVIGDVNNSSAGNDNLGGLVGYVYKGSISKSLATGDVSGTTKLGGLVGRFDGIGISQSYAQGNVMGSFYGDPIDEVGNFYIGGLIGYGKGSISETYVSGSVKGIEEGPVYTGCIVGYVNGSMEITDSYFDSGKCNLPFEGKTGIAAISNTPAQASAAMQTVSTYKNWDFIDTWKIIDESYPKLQWYSSSLAEAVIETALLSGFVYDGKEKTPAVKSVKLYGSVLDAETDYTIFYQGNVNAGTASINVCGNGEYSGCKVVPFKISPVAVKLSIAAIDNQIYSGDSIRPTISVLVADTVVSLSSYRLTFSNNVNAGKASVQVTLTGNFSGSAKANFVIEKAKPIIKTLPTAQDIYYGQTLKKSILKEGVASVDGSFAWSKSDVIPEPENKGYEIMFTPSDMNNYLVVKDTIHLTVKKCVVVFTYGKDTLQVDSLMYGEIPQFDGEISRKATAQYIYTFKAWSPKIVGATGSDSYVAIFDSTLQKYTISFFSDDSLLQSSKYGYGDTPSLKSSNPKKKMSEGYSYKFKGWSPQIATVTEDAEYKAVYDSTIRSYTVTFMNGESTLSTMTVEYGKVPEYTGKPTKKSTEKYRYNFVGWNPKVAAITGNTQYQAVYDSVLQSYVVTFFNGTTVLQKDTLSYGVTPKYKGKTPTKKSSKTYSYKFKEWSPKIVTVTKTATYTAVFDSTKLTGIFESHFASSGLSVRTLARSIQIFAAPIGSRYVISDLQGRVLKKGRVETANFNITMPQSGIYLVCIGNDLRKVTIR
ncbi:hypothetical protein [Fibrobacter sp.]|uniref:hypothetical protein n=1 Tax=Fibrobacter sp. TaxID=35828 RepID=UPI0025B9D7B8|nr:hypothetical protein [Fibrobacter sp.]MBR3072029.1 hypothetical protein [Fibrobacter sp.]